MSKDIDAESSRTIGVDTNCMNVYTDAKASQGFADYEKKNFDKSQWKIAVSYDS